jgi:NADH dehydrogenase
MVEPRHIVQPLRDIRGSGRFRFRRDTVTDIDFAGRRVIMTEGVERYDRLVVAIGSVVPSFGVPGVEEHALGYKWLEDGIVLRDHILDAAEHADHEPDPAARRHMLTVCVVGGGYTGVELIAELQDFFQRYIVPRYRGIDPGDYRLLLVEAGHEILRGVHPTLAERARRKLGREGIEIRTDTRVTRVLPGAVEVAGGEQVPVGLTIWAAGVTGHPALAHLPVERDRLGRVVTRPTMQLKDHPEVYGAGDAVTVEGNPTASIPIIPAALAHARLAAENILAELEGRPLGTIDFAPQGMLVSLGERDAVVEVFGLRLSGYFAWLFWNALHLWKLVGFRKQLQVALDWGMAQFFPRDSSIMRRVSRCSVCAHHTPYRERDAA